MKGFIVFITCMVYIITAEDVCVDDQCEETKSKGLDAFFVNNHGQSASLFWDNGDSYVQVVNSVGANKRTRISTFVGHKFKWMREGTQDPISDFIEIKDGITEYVLTTEAIENYLKVRGDCFDRHPVLCERESSRGECDRNPGWMIVNCPVSCNSCELLDPKKRCDPTFLNVSSENIWQPGDLNNLFEEILESYPELEPRAVSKPPDGPWIIVFEKFLNEAEANELIEVGGGMGFKRSTDTGVPNDRGEVTKVVSKSRTSENAWCNASCDENELIRGVSERIEKVTKVPQTHYEQFQLLRYKLGQYYRTHHDMGSSTNSRLSGGHRILTFFLYLSDVEEGGETLFPLVTNPETGEKGLAVQPKLGRAVLWPSVVDEDPYKRDERTHHAAQPVIKGTKFAANHWIHSHDFKKANLWGCTGAFD